MFKRKKKKTIDMKSLRSGVENITQEGFEEPKGFKPITRGVLRIVRVGIYAFILVVIAIGIRQLVVSKQPKIVENIVRYELGESESYKARAFAENFVRDYLTYGGEVIDNNEYRSRLEKYLVPQVQIGRPGDVSGLSKVLNTVVYDLRKIDDNRSDIIIKATVQLSSQKSLENLETSVTDDQETSTNQTIRVYYVSVPILARDQQIVVEDYPNFEFAEKKLDANMESYRSDVVSDRNIVNDVRSMLTDFFEIYYEGTSGQIQSYFVDIVDLSKFDSQFEFFELKSIEVFDDIDMISVVAVVKIKETELGTVFYQRFKLELVDKDERWMIKSIKGRGL